MVLKMQSSICPKENYTLASSLRKFKILFLSKMLSKSVVSQSILHMNNRNILEEYQSDFHTHHNKDTALIKVTKDLLHAADSGLLSTLILLDLSSTLAIQLTI